MTIPIQNATARIALVVGLLLSAGRLASREGAPATPAPALGPAVDWPRADGVQGDHRAALRISLPRV